MNDNRYSGATEAELGFLKEIVRMLPAGLTVQDATGELLLVNDAAAAQLGIDGSRPSPDLASRREACRQALSAGQAVVTEEALHTGTARQVLLTTHRPVRLAGRELLISTSSDITEQKNIQDQLRRLSGSIIAGQETERAAIARELHDELGQILTALRMDSVWLMKRLKEGDPKIA